MCTPITASSSACDPTSAPGKPSRFALEVAEDRSCAAIIAATDGGAVELVDARPGIGWAVDRCNELTGKHGVKVVLDKLGPAGVLADKLDNCEPLDSMAVIQSCEAMYDAIVEATVRFRAEPELGDPFSDAARVAQKKQIGDRFVWLRRDCPQVIPLMGASLAWRPTVGPTEPFILVGR
jgi:hypothetical protein